jgi:hypothetical protein
MKFTDHGFGETAIRCASRRTSPRMGEIRIVKPESRKIESRDDPEGEEERT